MKLSCSYEFKPMTPTCNTSYVQSIFGIGFEVGRNVIARDVEIDYQPGRIILFAGPSGSGKSSLLRAAADQAPRAVILSDSPDGDNALIDTLGADARAAGHLLSLCGLAEAFLMLRTPSQLSDGQRYRYSVAKCLAGGAATVVADEWCATLDRVTARVISRNVRKIADRRNVGFLLATTHEDIIEDLQPDTVVWCRGGGVVEVENRRPFHRDETRLKPACQAAARSVFYPGSKLPPVPRRTGRTSLGGIIAAGESDRCEKCFCSGTATNRSESVCSPSGRCPAACETACSASVESSPAPEQD